ncbi:hypothetical protein SADUNF_Sadunf04G0163800 [Salix dunnii]|uniref:Uncharacterized protein n=1 Tax=Salix dunnii TaxID=1413687 RepID=A0A835N1A8_9ROSI|nr:hypothetical protein SADUNF_Sadunf04G0163800 [Salix dunnii]
MERDETDACHFSAKSNMESRRLKKYSGAGNLKVPINNRRKLSLTLKQQEAAPKESEALL